MARAYASIDDKDNTIKFLNIAVENKAIRAPSTVVDMRFDFIIDDSRYQSLVNRMNL